MTAQNSDSASEAYFLDVYDREGRRLSLEDFYQLFEDPGYKVVRKSEVGWRRNVSVSTVWLGLNHAFTPDHPPLIFESMVFGGRHDGDTDRYSTEAEAIAGHERIVRRLGWFWGSRDVTDERVASYRAREPGARP